MLQCCSHARVVPLYSVARKVGRGGVGGVAGYVWPWASVELGNAPTYCPRPKPCHCLLCNMTLRRSGHFLYAMQADLLMLVMKLMRGGSLQEALRHPEARKQIAWHAR